MSLRIIYGRSGSGKTRFCLEEIKSELLKEQVQTQEPEQETDYNPVSVLMPGKRIRPGMLRPSKPVILLVPEQFTLQAEKDLSETLGIGGIIGAQVLSFKRMAFRIFNDAGGSAYPRLSPAGRNMMLFGILSEISGSYPGFKGSLLQKGFVSELSGMISEFKRCGMTPAKLREAAFSIIKNQDNEFMNRHLVNKINGLADIFSRYNKKAAESYADPGDDLNAAAEKLGSTRIYDGAEIWADGFSGFTPVELFMLRSLLACGCRISVTMCTDSLSADENDVFKPVRDTCRKLVNMAENSGIKIEPGVKLPLQEKENQVPDLPRFRKSIELSHLESNFDAYPYKIFTEKTRDISLHVSPNPFAETEDTAGEIIRLCRDRGMRFRDIAVIAGDLNYYSKLVEVIFREFGIPCFIDEKKNVMDHPLIRMLLALFDIINKNWTHDAMFRYIKTGLAGIDENMSDHLENYVLACGIRGKSRWTSEKDWDMKPGIMPYFEYEDKDNNDAHTEKDIMALINEARRRIAVPAGNLCEKISGKKKASEICKALYNFFEAANIIKKIENTDSVSVNYNGSGQASEYRQVWDMLLDLMDQAVNVAGDAEMSMADFAEMFKAGMDVSETGRLPVSLDQVIVGSPGRSRIHNIKALFVMGVNDGNFPKITGSEGILADDERTALKEAG
ncbi:MAG: exodeoxyribonuclease V subunit gamma, partial [Eubacteriales bacterium]|nr:exodeoxyribonuclease V subunit gamma [Eubacteriales bacterium]